MCVCYFSDLSSRGLQTYALACRFWTLFGTGVARRRPEIHFDYLFKAEKVTFRANSENRKSRGREKGSVHRFISLGMVKVLINFSQKSPKRQTLIFVVVY